jgi:hypothetical protein
MFPPNFLYDIIDEMHQARQYSKQYSYIIDWDELELILKAGKAIDVHQYHHDLINEENHPKI